MVVGGDEVWDVVDSGCEASKYFESSNARPSEARVEYGPCVDIEF